METERILAQWDQGTPETGWVVFRYRPFVAVARLLYPLVMGGLALAGWLYLFGRHFMAHPLREAFQQALADTETNLVFAFLLLWALACAIVILRRLRELWSAGSNVLLLTPHGIVKRFKGCVEHFPWSAVSGCTQRITTGRSLWPQREIYFTDQRTGRVVQLVGGRQFGSPQAMMQGIAMFT
ncbi:MAG: hypothetical protein HY696_03045 [Deltaproteobacteria bacterium]|nr:hypothetical protein [Deltaproteobacteria bacterium]